ncbi:hypothetical protein CMI37_20475 [Candidatus Pacearchaeota archaeon]|nr:hypothetical protein [Candidatus Pacearchaeota archaeon]
MEYYKLPKDKRWLGSYSPYDIGGRSTDVSQIGYSLRQIVKDMFPVNSVPLDYVEGLTELQSCLDRADQEIERFIEWVSDQQ